MQLHPRHLAVAAGLLAGCSLLIDPPRYDTCPLDPPVAPRCEGDALIACEDGFLVTRSCELGCSGGACIPPAERVVNTTIEGDQDEPSIAASTDGFLIVFEDDSRSAPDRLGKGVRGRVLNACGLEVGPDFLINEIVVGSQDVPRAAGSPGAGGIYLVVWNDDSGTPPDADGTTVRARALRKDGTYAGPDMVVPTSTAGAQLNPSVAAAPEGGFLVVWESDARVIYGRRFASDGAAIGLDFPISEIGTGVEYPVVAYSGNGRYLVAWEARELDKEIHARFVGIAGDLIGEELRVNDATPGEQLTPALAAGEGATLAVWTDEGPKGQGLPVVISGRMIGAAGLEGGGLTIAGGRAADQVDPVAAGIDGGFVVVWAEEDAEGVADIWSRTIGVAGSPLTDPVRVHDNTVGDQDDPAVANGLNGSVAAWGDMSLLGDDPFLDSVRYRFFPAEGSASCE
jgi:hypothetical protein